MTTKRARWRAGLAAAIAAATMLVGTAAPALAVVERGPRKITVIASEPDHQPFQPDAPPRKVVPWGR